MNTAGSFETSVCVNQTTRRKNHTTSYCKQFFQGGRDVIAGLGGVPQVLPTQQRLIIEWNRRTSLNWGAERIRQLYWLLRLVIDHRDESRTWVEAAVPLSCIQHKLIALRRAVNTWHIRQPQVHWPTSLHGANEVKWSEMKHKRWITNLLLQSHCCNRTNICRNSTHYFTHFSRDGKPAVQRINILYRV